MGKYFDYHHSNKAHIRLWFDDVSRDKTKKDWFNQLVAISFFCNFKTKDIARVWNKKNMWNQLKANGKINYNCALVFKIWVYQIKKRYGKL